MLSIFQKLQCDITSHEEVKMFYIRWSVAFFLVIVIIPAISHADNAGDKSRVYSYVDIGSDNWIDIDEIRSSVLLQDFGLKATFCNNKSAYYCVNSDLFFFAVPKHLTKGKNTWVVDGHFYRLVSPLTKMLILGSTIELCIITTSSSTKHSGKGTTYYYYSPRLGLIAYGVKIQPGPGETVKAPDLYPMISVLTGPVGFGAER